MPIQDKATDLSLRYLRIIENQLNITWNEQGEPVCVIDWISAENLQCLRDELDSLLRGKLSEEALQASAEYGKRNIQTVGFGHASNFDQFVKLGFIYGDRVVLWDVINSRLFMAVPPSKMLIAQTACNLLMLRSVVECGGLVILPHPIQWSPLAQRVAEELRAQGNKCAATLGISMALAAIDCGVPLHPYTLLSQGPQPRAHGDVSSCEISLYSQENYIFHTAITSLLIDQRISYLNGVGASDFYNVVSKHNGLQHALRKHFISDLQGLSPQQTQVALNRLTDDLLLLLEKRNQNVINYVADGGEATVSFVVPALTALTVGITALDALAAGGISAALIAAVRKWVDTPKNNVIVQAFSELSDQKQQHISNLSLVEDVDNNSIKIYEDINEIYEIFISLYWTEERHYFLKNLSTEVARKLLALLSSQDLSKIVNHREFQEDYIGDYLDYLSEIDETAFWEHIGKTFESEEGILVYDNDSHIRVMCSREMPNHIWLKLLNSLFIAYRQEMFEQRFSDYELETLKDIIVFQTIVSQEHINKMATLMEWLAKLTKENKVLVMHFFKFVYGDELPPWLLDASDQ